MTVEACVGLMVQTPMVPCRNNGNDKAPAVITFVGGEGPNEGTMVNIMVFPDGVDAVPYGLTDVELFGSASFTPPGISIYAWNLDC